ncbi:mucin-17 [Vespula squamosa]|uniref:Mucin-17 n=1 Tax=Vespula squamosa TaxID=30214 RepID=A0ABD2AFS0_VESSQ
MIGKDTLKEEEEGRKLNLATRVMSNGVEVIVAGPTPALRWENSNPQPTLTLSDAVVMLLPQEKSSDFVTKTCTTTFTYFGTINNSGNSVIATEIISNAASEEYHKKTGSETASVVLEPSPTLRTEVLKTTYTYLTVDKNNVNMEDSLISSTKVVTNKITAPQHYLHMMLEPSEVSHPETNTYLSTKVLEKTYMEDGHTRVQTSDKINQLITTESGSPPKPTSVITTLTALDSTEEAMTDIMKTYYITYTYYNTFFEKGTSVIRTNVATSTNVVLEKIPTKDTSTTKVTQINATPEPIQIFATKTYLTTFTYFTTLLQAGPDGETSTTISSRSHIIENVVTESIAPSLLDAGYMNALLTTAYHSDPVKNVVTGSTIIFFDEEDQIDPTTSSNLVESTASVGIGKVEKPSENLTLTTLASVSSDSGESTVNRVDYINNQDNNITTLLNNTVEHKRPSTHDGGDIQLSNLLHLGSLGINGLSALKPVITAMAGLLQGKTATRRNDTEPSLVTQETTTQRSPIYIPVAEFADDDIEVAESQNIAAHLVNPKHNHIGETRHKVTSSLADGIPISPGEVITANSDVIIGKPGKMAPRPPQNFVKEDEHIGMKPPPLPVPNIPVHPVLEILEKNREDFQEQHPPNIYKEQLQIIPSHRIYEEHLKIPLSMSLNAKLQVVPTQPQKLHPVESVQTNKIELKHEIIQHDPLLKPPDKPGTEKLINKQSEWSTDGSRGPWGATNPLTPPALPVTFSDLYSEKPVNDKSWPTSFKQQKHPNWAQKDSFLPDGLPEIQTSETQSSPSEPIVHQVPHIIDRSTGQPLLVNIQPSQVANVMIPQDGTQALIFGDTGERHISGQYFDDPSPYPEPETGPGFVGIQKAEDLFQNLHGKDPLNYMVPPSPPSNFKPAIQKTNSSIRPHIIRLPQVRFDHIKPPGKLEPPFIRSDKRPAEIHVMKQPHQSSVTNGQGFVHSEILVHHRPETLNLQLASHTPMLSNSHPTNSFSSNGQFVKNQKPLNTLPTVPSRRAESTISTEIPHIYTYHNKPDSGNEVISNTNWKINKKPPRITLNNRLRPQSVLRPTTHRPHNRPTYIEKPINSVTTKTTYTVSPKLPFKPQNTALLPHQVSSNTYLQYEYSNKPISIGNKNMNNVTNQGITHNYQVNFQDRLPQTNPEKTNLLNSGESITKWHNDQTPIGAIEYHNPSYLKIKSENTGYYSPMLIITSKNHTIDSIHFDAQNQSRPSDSEIAESEHIKSHQNVDSSDINYEKKLNAAINLQNNKTAGSKNNYGMINTDKPSFVKPSIAEQSLTYNKNDNTPILHPGEPFKLKNNSTISINDTFYGTKTYEIPVVKSKPHKMYGGNANRDKHHEYREKESEFDYKTVQESSPIYLNDQKPLKHRNENVQSSTLRYSYEQDDTIDLKPPAIIPQFRPVADHESTEFYSKPHVIVTPETRPTRIPVVEIITKPTDMVNVKQNSNVSHINNLKSSNFDSFVNQNSHKEYKIDQQQQTISEDMVKQYATPSWNIGTLDTNMYMTQKKSGTKQNELTNYTIPDSIDKKVDTRIQKLEMKTNHPSHFLEQGLITGVHPEYPHIITKPKLQVPDPVVISSTAMKPDSHIQSNVQFSMPVEITDDEQNDSKTQTERPPSMLIIKTNSLKNKNQDKEMLETAYQTNFASLDSVIGNSETHKIKSNSYNMSIHNNPQNMFNIKDPKVPSRDMMPPPLNSKAQSKLEDEQQKLKPPPPPSNDVLGLSPPPLEITTTYRPMQHRPDPIIINEPDLKLSSKYIPLKELTKTIVPQPNMKSSNLRTTITKSFLPEQLSERMVPSPPALQTKSFEISTTKIGILPFGSTQKPTTSISNIYINQYVKSKYTTTQNTIKPSVIGTPILRSSISTKEMEHSNDPGVPVRQTAITTTKTVTSTQVKSSGDQIKSSKPSLQPDIKPTKSLTFDTSHTSVKLAEQPIFLQSSHDYILPSVNTEPTESLTFVVTTDGIKESTVKNHDITKTHKQMNATITDKIPVVPIQTDKSLKSSDSSLTKEYTDFKINETTSVTVKPNVGTVIYENVSDTNVGVKPKEIVRIKMSTLTKIETFAVGLPPTTRTFLLTHTMTSTTVETVTETFLHPTNTLATMTSNILQSMVTRLPSIYENSIDNDSIFVVMSDQKPPEPGAEEVEAEYGEEDISRDEQNPTNNEIHRVLAGGILGAPVVPLRPTNQCTPECKGSKAETCVEVENEMRCVCRPGFARMFPDRPCKPTYTYTLHVGLDRIGHEPVAYQESLNDSTSLIYRRLAGSVKDALDRTLMQSDLRDIYRALKISKFTSDPVKVVFHVQLSDNANETRLKEVLRKYLVGSNYSLGGTEVYASKNLELIHASDFDECSIEEDGPHHDCSPNAACFNLRGSYQCSCKEGWADLSENPAYPGRICSQAPIGCAGCNNKGHCITNIHGQEICECFPWYSGQRCQVNLKVMLIALVTTGAILLGLLAVCVGLACFRQPVHNKHTSGDTRAMISGAGGDTSSEDSVGDVTIPYHVPHVLPPPPQMIAPLPPMKRPIRKISEKSHHPSRKPIVAASEMTNDEQRDRSLTVMIPRAKYRSAPQSPQNYKTTLSTFVTDEHKLINYLDNGSHHPGNRKQSISSTKDCKESDLQAARAPAVSTGALVSAGFQVSATVTRMIDAESTLARSCGETTIEPPTKVLKNCDSQGDLTSTLARSCGETTIQTQTKLLRQDLAEAGSILARSCEETTIQPFTKIAATRTNSIKDTRNNKNSRDNGSEGHTMAERDLGSTLRLPPHHPPLYSPDRLLLKFSIDCGNE